MYCNQCGKELQPEQRFCGQCGSVAAGVTAVVPQDSMARHVHLLGILWLVLGALTMIGGLAVLVVAHTVFGPRGVAVEDAPHFLRPLLTLVGFAILAKAALTFILGIGLLQRQSWARVLGIVLGIISLLHVPFGTALGIYTLWVLLSADAEQRYARLAGVA